MSWKSEFSTNKQKKMVNPYIIICAWIVGLYSNTIVYSLTCNVNLFCCQGIDHHQSLEAIGNAQNGKATVLVKKLAKQAPKSTKQVVETKPDVPVPVEVKQSNANALTNCEACGYEIPHRAKFCPDCGHLNNPYNLCNPNNPNKSLHGQKF